MRFDGERIDFWFTGVSMARDEACDPGDDRMVGGESAAGANESAAGLFGGQGPAGACRDLSCLWSGGCLEGCGAWGDARTESSLCVCWGCVA